MRIDYVNQQIMDAMLAGYPMPRYAELDYPIGVKKRVYIVCTDGHVAYVLEENEICFNLARCRNDPSAFKNLLADEDLLRIDNMLEPTHDIRAVAAEKYTVADWLSGEKNHRLLARLKGATWDTFADMDLLEAFDAAKYYQAKRNGPIAIVEEGTLVGYVMPTKCDDLTGHYTDSPSPENPLFDDEEE